MIAPFVFLLRWLLGAALVFSVVVAHAGSLMRTNVGGYEVRNSGNTWTMGPATARPGDMWQFERPPGSASGAGAFGFSSSPGGGPAAAALGRFAGKSARALAGPLVIGMAGYELLKELGVDWGTNDQGYQSLIGPGKRSGSVWFVQNGNGQTFGTAQEACSSLRDPSYGVGGAVIHSCSGGSAPGATCSCEPNQPYSGRSYGVEAKVGDIVIPNAGLTPEQVEALAEQRANGPDWDPEMDKHLGDAINSGEEVKTNDPPKVNGPGSVQGPSQQSTEQTAQGPRTVTTTNTYNATYINNTVTINNTSTRTTIEPDGTTRTDTETGETPEEPAPPVVDADMPPVPDLYERKYPDGLAGVWNEASAAFKQTPIFTFLAGLTPQGLDGGGCPTWQFQAGQVLGIQVGGDLSVPCYVWAFLRMVMVISAVLLARRLIFGG